VFLASNGAFEGDGYLKCSYKNPDNNKMKSLLVRRRELALKIDVRGLGLGSLF
jgi:hypothetical protein